MDKKQMDKRQEGIKKLVALPAKERADLDKLIELENEYNLGYNHIVEFCDPKYRKAMYVLTHYCQLRFNIVLQLLKANANKLSANLTDAEIVSKFTNISLDKANKLVEEIDKLDKERNETFGKKFARALANGLNATNGGHAIYVSDLEEAKKAGVSLNQYLFVSAFNREMQDDDIFAI